MAVAQETGNYPWKVLIVDDEPDVHAITRLVLRETSFEGRRVEFLNAYSAREAEQILREERDVAAAIVDVVMETDDAGLRLAKWIREVLRNRLVRIILRTGRPGEAPERAVIVDYDINDYREKSELTDVRLLTMLVSALRGYRDLHMLELSRRGFARIVEASGSLFRNRTVPEFVGDVLVLLGSLVCGSEDSILVSTSGVGIDASGRPRIIAATGRYDSLIGQDLGAAAADDEVRSLVESAMRERRSISRGCTFAGFYQSVDDHNVVLAVQREYPIGPAELGVLEAFNANVSLAFENLTLNRHIEGAQRAMIYMLGEAIEKRSEETGNHVKRVARLVTMIARYLDVPEGDVQAMELAAPLHDIGKIAIPDEILKKPGVLTDDEMDLMKSHTTIGYRILSPHTQGVLRLGAVLARSHHERWLGQGYPDRLAGDAIPLPGRILAVADVVDALSHDRVYKKAWPLEEVFDHVKENSGILFDPAVADAFARLREEVVGVLME